MGASGLGTHVQPWWIHVNEWQNQYSIVKQNKVKIKIKKTNHSYITTKNIILLTNDFLSNIFISTLQYYF